MTRQIPTSKAAPVIILTTEQLTDILETMRNDHPDLNVAFDTSAGTAVVDYNGNEVLRGLQKSAGGVWICRTIKGLLTPQVAR